MTAAGQRSDMRDERRAWTGRLPIAWAGLLIGAALLRFVPVLQSSFPFGDGGLYYRYVQDVTAAGFVPPMTASYNGATLFPYPFLAFELVAGLARLGLDALEVMRFLPALMSVAGVAAFAWLAIELMGRGPAAYVGTLFYATLPEVYRNSILGGGITKALVVLVAILAMAVGTRAFRASSTATRLRGAVAAGVLCGLAQLAHPAGGLIVGVGLGFVLLLVGASRPRVATYVLIGVVAVAVSAPWWLRVVVDLGPGPLLGAAGNGRDPIAAVLMHLLYLAVTSWPAMLAIWLSFAEVVLTRRRELLLLAAWFAAASILDQRNSYLDAPVPFALLTGAAIAPMAARFSRALGRRVSRPSWNGAARVTSVAVGAALFAVPLLTPGALGARDPLRPPDLAAMDYVMNASATGTRFLVVTGAAWTEDDVSEWFPALTHRTSVATPQGQEWAGLGAFDRAVERHAAAQECATRTLACIDAWTASIGVPFDALYVAGPDAESSRAPEPTIAELAGLTTTPRTDCCAALRASVARSASWRIVYQGPGALIAVRHVAATSPRPSPAG